VLAVDVGANVDLLESSVLQAEEVSVISSSETATSSIANAEGESDSVSYDVSQDGTVSPLDALLVINAINDEAVGESLSNEVFAAYDINTDGELGESDVAMIVEYLEASNESSDDSLLTLSSSTPTPSPTPSPTIASEFSSIAESLK
jgi:Dockerin type I domain